MQETRSGALFIVPGENIDTPGPNGYIGHKFHYIYEAFVNRNWQVSVAIDVYSRDPSGKTPYEHSSLKILFAWKALAALFRFRWRGFRLSSLMSFVNQSALYETYKFAVLRATPKVVLAIGASEILTRVCKELGIPMVEIQHGMFTRLDLETYWPHGNYPDLIITWDKYSASIAQSLGVDSVVLGHPESNSIMNEELGSFVCVTLGYKADDSEDPWGCLPKTLSQQIDFLIESDVPILIRIHPMISASWTKSRAIEKWIRKRFGIVRVDNPRFVSLRDSIQDSFLNLTVLSATWFDFALTGISTAMLNKEAASKYREYADAIDIWSSGNSPIFFPPSENALLKDLAYFQKKREGTKSLELQGLKEFIDSLDGSRGL
jgi:hypothetical protein